MKKRNEGQCAFDFEAAVTILKCPQTSTIVQESQRHPSAVKDIKEPERKLDGDGHRWWASVCRNYQQNCIAQANGAKDAKEVGEWAAIAKTWKQTAAEHEEKANLLGEGH